MTMQQPPKVRYSPRISAPKFGEYLGVATNANRRERILRDQKYPFTFMVSRYKSASNLIRATLLTGGDVVARLTEKAGLLGRRPTATKFEADSARCCVLAVRHFARLYDSIKLKGVTAVMTGKQGFPLEVENVAISVAPTVLLARTKKDGTVESGGLLLVYRKDAALDSHGAQAVAELMRQALVEAGHQNVQAKLCIVVDVFSGLIVTAPARRQRLWSEIESACREIAVRWSSIEAA